jgi:ABC-type oligopeptide transport system substrate-binding subunit
VEGRVRGRRPWRRRCHLAAFLACTATLALVDTGALGSDSQREGGIFRISFEQFDYVDPALGYTLEAWSLLDTTCARLMSRPDKPAPEGFRLVPEVASDFPKVSRNGKTYTFTLRRGFRFSDGTPVLASAFARAINRVLTPDVRSPGAQFMMDIAGAADVQAGKTRSAAGIVARGNRLVIRLTRPAPDFPARTTMPFFCAVPPNLPSDPEGVRTFPAAGPYVIAEYRAGERVVLRRNRFYGGSRPHHVDGFDVDLRASSSSEILDRVETRDIDWSQIVTPEYFDPARRLVARYGVNRSQFFVKPGLTLNLITFNHARPLFANNPRLRQAVNFALDRRVIAKVSSASPLDRRLTEQYLPSSFPGVRDARIYPLERADVARARSLARGNTRRGKAVLYVPDFPPPLASAQAVKQQLAAIGLTVEIEPIPPGLGSLTRLADNGWDLALGLWTPDFLDPHAYINLLFEGRYTQGTNIGHFDSPKYNRLMRQAGALQGRPRYERYGALDVELARDAAPIAALSFFNEATLVSERVGCVVLRPTLDLTAVCLK